MFWLSIASFDSSPFLSVVAIVVLCSMLGMFLFSKSSVELNIFGMYVAVSGHMLVPIGLYISGFSVVFESLAFMGIKSPLIFSTVFTLAAFGLKR